MKTRRIPFLDLSSAYDERKTEIDAAVLRVAASGRYLLGPELKEFEADWRRACGALHCSGTANGLDALHLSLRALGIGPGDEVIVPSHTFIATWLAVSLCGATIVAVEPDEATFNLSPSGFEAAVTSRTRAVVPVHLYGQPADMNPIVATARRHGIKVLDDCAQAHLARYHGRPVGSLADLSAWSFYPGKNLGAFGDAGAVTGNDGELVERVGVLGNYGSRVKYHHEVVGYNSRLDEIQAAILSAKLPALEYATQRRQAIAKRYLEGLGGLPLKLPEVPAYAEPAWHLFVVRHLDRRGLQERLSSRGIETLIHYPVPPHLQPAYAHLGYQRGRFPIAERMHDEVLSLPMWPAMDASSIEQVIDAVRMCA